MPDIIDIPAAPTSSDAATAPATANPMKGMLARIDALNAQNIARSTRMTEVEPLLGGAKYDLPSITARIQENAATMAQAAMQIGASLIAVKTVEGHGEFDKWLETAGLPFRRSMAYMFISNTRKVLMDERLLPVLGLGISKAELLLRAVTDADAEELAEHGTIQGRPLDAYDAMGRRELEAQVRGLREERDKLAEKVENAKTEVKAVRLAREEDMKERDKNVQDLKKELALARMPRTPDEEQAHVLQKFDEHLQKMRGIWYFIDPQAAAEIMINAPITHLAQVHIFFQEMFMMAKHHLLTFEKYAMVTSPAGIDAAIAQIDNMAYDTEKTPSFEEWEEQCRKEDEEEARKKGAGTIPFNRKR